LKAQDVLDPENRARRCDLLLAQAEAMLPLENPARIASSVAEEAFGLAEALHDAARAGRAAVVAADALIRAEGRVEGYRRPELRRWVERADQYARPGTVERVYADLYSGLIEIGAGRPPEAHIRLRRGVDRAFELGDDSAFFAAA